MRIAFCVMNVSRGDIERSEFYRQDIEILRSLGHEVDIVLHPWELRPRHDVAFVWWWNYLWAWGPVARALRIPIVTTGTFDVEAYSHADRVRRTLKAFGSRFSARNIFVSELEAERVPQLVRLAPDSIRYSPHVVDTDVYRPAPRLPSSVFRVANVCWQRLPNMRRKMLPELVDAFARFHGRHPDTRLTLAGPPLDGGPVLLEQVRALGIAASVDMPGEISRDDKIRLMQQSDVYCQVSRYEGFGVAIAEAMACGCPVIVSRAGAVPEVVGDCGVYVDDLSVDAIDAALERCYQDRPLLARNAAAGRDRVMERFSVERRRRDFERALAEVS